MIHGVRIDPTTGKPMDSPEEENFLTRGECGQAVDMRNLVDVLHHNEIGHKPIGVPS